MSGVHLATTMNEVMCLVDDLVYTFMPAERAQRFALAWKNTMMQQMKWHSKLAQGHACPDAYNTQWNACRHCLERMIDDDDYPVLYMLVEDWMMAEEVQKGIGFE